MPVPDTSCGSSPGGIGVVVIGRNEGERLRRCLASLGPGADRIVYVDSGSTDGSVAAARAVGAGVVELDLSRPFTAARARNAGLAVLNGKAPPEFVQFIDGDCEMAPGWLGAARDFLVETPGAAAVSGRLRERFPEKSVYNRLCDEEWNLPAGRIRACGGIAMMRLAVVAGQGGFREDLIAGEEPELCLRMRHDGWEIWRIDHEMGFHDADITRFAQWWTRSRRGGHAYAEGAALHGNGPEPYFVAEMRRLMIWGAFLPVSILLLALLVSPWALALFLVYPLQVFRLSRRYGWQKAFFTTLSRFPEARGAADYYWKRWRGRRQGLIEYK
ncbi:glycosyltransferase [Tropicimonas sp.]|uniref:glycosyltransferase n=1 Tax=Tropicimonas sp. TaxID=2067044 RepID=UPI003A8B621E